MSTTTGTGMTITIPYPSTVYWPNKTTCKVCGGAKVLWSPVNGQPYMCPRCGGEGEEWLPSAPWYQLTYTTCSTAMPPTTTWNISTAFT